MKFLKRFSIFLLLLSLGITGCGTTPSPVQEEEGIPPSLLKVQGPRNSKVYLNGLFQGLCNEEGLLEIPLSRGSYVISLVYPDGAETFRRIQIEEASQVVNFNPEITAPSNLPEETNPPKEDEAGKVKSEEFEDLLFFDPLEITPGTKVSILLPEGVYTGDVQGGVSHGYGTFRSSNGETYTGTWKDGKREGFGKIEWPDGSWYEGGWKDNQISGEGTLVKASGDSYKGSFSQGTFNGQGTYTWSNGDVYSGDWLSGKPQGLGVFFSSQETYSGEWFEGMRHGVGIAEWANGDSYEGQWQWDKPSGEGLFRSASGEEYEGQWQEGIMQGVGIYKYSDGSIYQGLFEKGTPAGGWYTDPSGNTFEVSRRL